MQEFENELGWQPDLGSIAHAELAVIGPEPSLQADSNSPAGRKVLVLEDDPALRQLLVQQLRSVGFEVTSAATVEQAWQRLTENSIQLAIFDVHLPDGSGLELCERIDSDRRTAGLPVIVLSSSHQPDVVRKTRACGACFFLGKPYDPNVLLALVELALDDRV